MEREANPASLTPEQLAGLLSAACGRTVRTETLLGHVGRGAPATGEGEQLRINLLHYAAWLVRELDH